MPPTSFGFFVGLVQNHRVQLPGMPVELIGVHRRGGAPVGDHYDLLIRAPLTVEKRARQLQPSLGVRVFAPGGDKREIREAKLLGGIPKAHNIQDVMRKMDPNQLGQSQSNFFGRGKSLLPSCSHALAHIQNENRRM